MNSIQKFVWGRPPRPGSIDMTKLPVEVLYRNNVDANYHTYIKPPYADPYNITFDGRFVSEETDFFKYSCDIRITKDWIGYDNYSLSEAEKFGGLEFLFCTGTFYNSYLQIPNHFDLKGFDVIEFSSDTTPFSTYKTFSAYHTLSMPFTEVFNIKYQQNFMSVQESSCNASAPFPFSENVSDQAIIAGEIYFRFANTNTGQATKPIKLYITFELEYNPY